MSNVDPIWDDMASTYARNNAISYVQNELDYCAPYMLYWQRFYDEAITELREGRTPTLR